MLILILAAALRLRVYALVAAAWDLEPKNLVVEEEVTARIATVSPLAEPFSVTAEKPIVFRQCTWQSY